MSIKRLENLLNPNEDGGLGEIIRHARDMDTVLAALQDALPPEAAGSVRAANIRDNGELVVLASSSAWAAKLRFETDTLIEAASATGAHVTSCTVRVDRGD